MHFGNKNVEFVYSMNSNNLETVKEYKDLGIIINKDNQIEKQCMKVIRTANQISGMIKRNFASRNMKVMLSMHKSLVRLHLKYATQIWYPYLAKDINSIEKVQNKFRKCINFGTKINFVERRKKVVY